jgi:hypothetical protein
MSREWGAARALLALALLGPALPALGAPYTVGDRYFPATPGTEDPFVAETRLGAERGGNGTPAIYLAKGLGDFPDTLKYLRPLSMTGSFAYEVSDRRMATPTLRDSATGANAPNTGFFPDVAQVGGSVQYRLRDIEGTLDHIGLPPVVGRFTPVLDFSLATPTGRSHGAISTATLAPGVVYAGDRYYLGLETSIPMTRPSGSGAGFVFSLTLRFDSLLPAWFGTAPSTAGGDGR